MSKSQGAFFSIMFGLIFGLLVVLNYNMTTLHEWHKIEIDQRKLQIDAIARYGGLICNWLEEIARIEAHMPPKKREEKP